MTNSLTNIDISFIETKAPEEVNLAAEALVDDNAVTSSSSSKRGLWETTVVHDNLHYSCELQIRSKVLKSYRCNCNLKNDEEICPHVLASVIVIRRKLDEEEQQKQETKVKSKRNRRSDLPGLLKKLKRTDLEEFILARSRASKPFQLLVQARFIEFLPIDTLPDFIESTFPIFTKANEKVSPSRLSIFLEISKELKIYFRNLIGQNDFTTAYKLAFLHLRKSFYIKHHLQKEKSNFLKLHKELIANFIEIYKLIDAPEYKQFISEQLIELLGSSFISANIQEERDMWMSLYNSLEDKTPLKEVAQKYISRFQSSDYESLYFIHLISIISSSHIEAESQILSRSVQEDYRIIHFLVDYKSLASCNINLQRFYILKKLNNQMAKLVIKNISPEENLLNKIWDKSIENMITFKDATYIDFLEEHKSEDDYPIEFVFEKLRETGNASLIIDAYLRLGKTDLALNLLSSQLDWPLIRRFDQKIFEENSTSCTQLYIDVLKEYLKDHFGIHAKDFIQDVFRRGQQIGMDKELSQIKAELLEHFRDRKLTFPRS